MTDKPDLLFVSISNNGVGPIVLEELEFKNGVERFTLVQDGLILDLKIYDHFEINKEKKKVLIPGGYLNICYKDLHSNEDEAVLLGLKMQLSFFTVTAFGRDIYGNVMTAKQDLKWFARHGFPKEDQQINNESKLSQIAK